MSVAMERQWRDGALELERDPERPPLFAPIPGKRSRVYGAYPPVQRLDLDPLKAAWEDATMGLTGRQHGSLQVKLRWIANLRAMASRPPVRWEVVHQQAEQLLADLSGFLATPDLTSRAEQQLAPSLTQASALRDLVFGAMKPLPEVRKQVGSRLSSAANAMDKMKQVWVDDGSGRGRVVKNRAELDQLIAEGKASEEKKLPQTNLDLASDADEAAIRGTYAPLDDTAAAFVQALSTQVYRISFGLDDFRPGATPLEKVKGKVEEVLAVWDNFATHSAFSRVLAVQREQVRLQLDGAHKMIIGKLAPLQNTLNLLQSLATNVERDIKATLALPRRRDPEHGDGPESPSPPGAILNETPETRMVPEPQEPDEPLQHRRRAAARDPAEERAIAAGGLAGHGSPIPHLATLQRAFGRHELGDVRAHTGPEAAAANEAMGSVAYAMGDSIAFGPGSVDLFTAAHEAAHVIQQRAGAVADGQVGRTGDRFERHADQVAERVVSGESAEDLLDQVAGVPAEPS